MLVDHLLNKLEISQTIQKFKETGNLKHLHRNKLDEACFDHDVAYFDNKDLAKRTVSDIFLKDRAYEIAKNPKYDGYEGALQVWSMNVLI